MKTHEELKLFTPGPTSVPPRILAAGARPMLHHRTPEFSAILTSLVVKAQQLLGTNEDILLVHASGRGAMEATILNLFSQGDSIISVCNGKFGEMYAEIGEKHGLHVKRICRDWLQDIDLAEIEAEFQKNPNVRAITVCHCETTTAVINDIESIAGLAKKYDKLMIVDAISSAGCLPIEFDQWNLDVLVTASQKGLMSPTGLSLVCLSQKAWQALEQSSLPKYYIQFREIQKNLHGIRAETPGSTPVSLACAVEEALTMIMQEGKSEVYSRHEKIACAIRAGLTGMGLEIFPRSVQRRSAALTAFEAPEGLTSSQIRNTLKKEFGIVAAEGLGNAYKEKVVRIGHMGNIFPADAITIIGALESVLVKLGFLKEAGKGIAACIRSLE